MFIKLHLITNNKKKRFPLYCIWWDWDSFYTIKRNPLHIYTILYIKKIKLKFGNPWMDDAIQNGMWKHSYKMGRKGHIKSSNVKKALSQN